MRGCEIQFREAPLSDDAVRFETRLYLLPYGYVDHFGGRSSDDVQAWKLTQESRAIRVLKGITFAALTLGAFGLLWLLVA